MGVASEGLFVLLLAAALASVSFVPCTLSSGGGGGRQAVEVKCQPGFPRGGVRRRGRGIF